MFLETPTPPSSAQALDPAPDAWPPPRLCALTLAAGRASRGLPAASASAFILCLSSLGFYRFRLINSIRS